MCGRKRITGSIRNDGAFFFQSSHKKEFGHPMFHFPHVPLGVQVSVSCMHATVTEDCPSKTNIVSARTKLGVPMVNKDRTRVRGETNFILKDFSFRKKPGFVSFVCCELVSIMIVAVSLLLVDSLFLCFEQNWCEGKILYLGGM